MDENQDSQGTQKPTSSVHKNSDSKEIRPSEEFLNEIKNNQLAQPNTVSATPDSDSVQPSPHKSPALTQSQTTDTQSTTNSIYPETSPEPTKGIDISNSQAATLSQQNSNKKSMADNKSKVIKILIIVLGVYIAGSALIGLVGGIKLLTFGVTHSTGALLTAIDIVYLLVGVGLIIQREIARIIYIVLAVIGLALSSIGLYRYFHVVVNTSNLQQQSKQSIIASTNKEIANYQSNNTIPANQKAQIIQEIKNSENNELKTSEYPTVTVKKTIEPLIEGYAIAIIPLIFLTRPSVREEFE